MDCNLLSVVSIELISTCVCPQWLDLADVLEFRIGKVHCIPRSPGVRANTNMAVHMSSALQDMQICWFQGHTV
ncbi:hypothetical protein Y1Q_0001880 [Alligator mississippiensis]|uniref:Uncharacterized protein n=1 Tax=Alligator mississippiensis TaxID=8496 RepID=A0A151PG45_ALLMI|nr:hypothetical protein Y1Q_0001880 [Alligator mississippiensis]